jgi:pilus assembly protein FimV
MESGEAESLKLDEADLELSSGDLEVEASSADEAVALDLGQSDTLDSMDLDSIERELEGLSEGLENEEGEPLDLPSVEESESIELDLDTTDEVTTKLDLARAYIDMGDSEGAKSILEEVVNEGNDQQKEEAQELMNNIG